jgi:hypothetical protein
MPGQVRSRSGRTEHDSEGYGDRDHAHAEEEQAASLKRLLVPQIAVSSD